MKNRVLLAIFLMISSPAFAEESLEWKLTSMIGLSMRFDTSNEDFNNSYQNQREDVPGFTYKLFPLEYTISNSGILLMGVGYNYHFNNTHDISISPFAFRSDQSFTLSFDLFQSNVRGGWAGLSVGFSF